MNYVSYYDLETYLFGEVSERYREDKTLSAFDLFCIVIWKANRSKSKVAKRLLAQGYLDLESAVTALVASINDIQDNEGWLRVLIDHWGFRLPMASAILAVLFPEEFTVYDVRVCEVLGDFKDAQYKTKYEALWQRYPDYVCRVKEEVPWIGALREKDRYLWGKSFALQLKADIDARFGAVSEN